MDTGQAAYRLASLGYYLTPISPGEKRPTGREWEKLRLTPDEVEAHWQDHPEHGIGLLCGTGAREQLYVVAFDVDSEDENLINRVRCAIGGDPPAKRGRKGITFIARASGKPFTSAKHKPDSKSPPLVERLSIKNQTVLPPSIHPDTQLPYQWLNRPLHETDPETLPAVGLEAAKEIELAVKKPDLVLFEINDMKRSTDGEPGNAHDTILRAVPSFLTSKFTDTYIKMRCLRAYREADARAGIHDRMDYDDEESHILEAIKSAKEKGLDTPSKGDSPFVVATHWVLRDWRGSGTVYNRFGQLMVYKDGWYESYTPDAFGHLLTTVEHDDIPRLGYDWISKLVDNVLMYAPRFPDDQVTRKVCLLNGTYDFTTGSFGSHSPDDFLIAQLPITYDPDAKCELFNKVVARTLAVEGAPEDGPLAVSCFLEFVSMTLFECHDYHRFLVLQGASRSGKSVLAGVAKAFHKGCSAVMAHDLNNEKARTSMLTCLLNIANETSTVSPIADEFIKAIVGGDTVTVRHLYQAMYSVALPTRLLILTNEPLKTRDASAALMERALILPCDNVVPAAERDVHLPAKLREELPGIFNLLTHAWPRLVTRGQFMPPASSQAKVDELERESNPVLQWLLENTHQGRKHDNPEYVIPANDAGYTDNGILYNDYVEWSKTNGFAQMSSTTWGMRMMLVRALGDIAVYRKSLPGGNQVRVRPLTLTTKHKY